jgi:hypothetical protein
MFRTALLPLLALSTAAASNIKFYNGHTAEGILPYAPPAPNARNKAADIVRLFQHTGRSTTWELVAAVPLEGETWEPEGMVRLGPDRIIVSAGEYTLPTVSYGKDANGSAIIINGTDRANGAGFAHLLVFDAKGKRVADATLTTAGDPHYHNGGIDYDGTYIWCAVAEYRPNSSATLYRVDPRTLVPTPLFNISDHEGGVVHDINKDTVTLLNWGGRNASTFRLPSTGGPVGVKAPISVVRDPSYFVDYQARHNNTGRLRRAHGGGRIASGSATSTTAVR